MNSETLITIASLLSGPAALALFNGISWLVKKKSSRTDEDKVDSRTNREKYVEEVRTDNRALKAEFDAYRIAMDIKIQKMEERYERRELAHQEEIEKKNKQIKDLEDRIDVLEEQLVLATVANEIKAQAKEAIHQSIDDNLNPIIKTQ